MTEATVGPEESTLLPSSLVRRCLVVRLLVPGNRVTAALGAAVVEKDADDVMASAWIEVELAQPTESHVRGGNARALRARIARDSEGG